MLRKAIVIASVFCSTAALGFSGTLTSSISKKVESEKFNPTIGLAMNHPIGLGFGWYSWSGGGIVKNDDKTDTRWIQTIQGVDFGFKNLKVGVFGKIKHDEPENDETIEYGARLNLKLW